MSEPVSLQRLAHITRGHATGAADVRDVTHDSRAVAQGTLFVAIRGAVADGHRFVTEAIERGAAAVAVDHEIGAAVPELVVADTRQALAPLAAEVYGHPARALRVIGVTGTNGKTTVTHLLERIAVAAELSPGIVGTVGARSAGVSIDVARTTPEASDLQRILRRMVDDGVDLVGLEVSSHALALHRADAIEFDIVAFTNLSQDHLDFHGDMERYFAAKAELFAGDRARVAVIEIDDPFGRRLAEQTPLLVTTVSVDGPADVTARITDADTGGSTFTIESPLWTRTIRLPMPGRFNVANAAVAAAIAMHAGIAHDAIAAGLAAGPGIPGRLQPVVAGQPFAVFVDYAHTPDAVAAAIESVRALVPGRITCVVGAAGDRDRAKRPLMGAAAAAADAVVLTSDNPRSEDPNTILSEVLAGAGSAAALDVIVDRRAAIASAISRAAPGDAVLILGKGHETGQEAAGVVTPFDDVVIAREALAARMAGNEVAR